MKKQILGVGIWLGLSIFSGLSAAATPVQDVILEPGEARYFQPSTDTIRVACAGGGVRVLKASCGCDYLNPAYYPASDSFRITSWMLLSNGKEIRQELGGADSREACEQKISHLYQAVCSGSK